MTNSSRRRMNRNAFRILAFIFTQEDSKLDAPFTGETVGQFISSRVPPRRLNELREEGVNVSLVAERLNIATRRPIAGPRVVCRSRFHAAHPSLREGLDVRCVCGEGA